MIIKILGMSGCSNCQNLKENVKKAVSELGTEAKVQKVDDIDQAMLYGAMAMPGLVIDEELIFSGRVPGVEEIKKLIENKNND